MSEIPLRLSRFDATFKKRFLVRFFIGDDKDGYGQLFMTLRDSVLDPSGMFDHCSQLVNTLKITGLKVTVLVLQTDGRRPGSLFETSHHAIFPSCYDTNVEH